MTPTDRNAMPRTPAPEPWWQEQANDDPYR